MTYKGLVRALKFAWQESSTVLTWLYASTIQPLITLLAEDVIQTLGIAHPRKYSSLKSSDILGSSLAQTGRLSVKLGIVLVFSLKLKQSMTYKSLERAL